LQPQQVLVEESAPAPIGRIAGVEDVWILRLARRQARDANPEVLNLEVLLTLGEVIQAVEGTDRVGVAPYTGGVAGLVGGPWGTLHLTRQSGSSTKTRKCGYTGCNRQQ
jgi:hypothetical protein